MGCDGNPGLGRNQVAVLHARGGRARVAGVASLTNHRSGRSTSIRRSVRRGKWCARLTISGPASLTRLTVEVPAYRRRSTSARRARGRRRVPTGLLTGALRSWLAFGDTPSTDRTRVEARRCRLCRHGAARRGADLSGAHGPGSRRSSLTCARTWPTRNVRQARMPTAYRAGELRDCVAVLAVGRSCGAGRDRTARRRCARFNVAVLTGGLSLRSNLSLASAIKESTLRRDGERKSGA